MIITKGDVIKTLLYKSILWQIIFLSQLYSQNKNANKSDLSGFLKLLSPRGTEVYNYGQDITLSWNHNLIDKINIDISYDGINWETLIENYSASDGKIILNLKKISDKKFKVRIREFGSNQLLDQTEYFSIIQNRELLRKSMLNNTTSMQRLKMMPLGNSITAGYTIPVPGDLEGYRNFLYESLLNNGLDVDFIGSKENGSFIENQHEGHGGWHIKHWFGNKNYSLIDSLSKFLTLNHPDIILLHAGTNDIGELDDYRNNNTIDTTVSDLSELLDEIYFFDSNIHVILARIINRIDNEDTENVNETDTTTTYNVLIQNMADLRIANGDKLTVVDMEPSINYSTDLPDSVHPNAVGYYKMANVWFNGIIDILPKLSLKVYIEGAYNESHNLQNQLTLPLDQPYNVSPWNYSGGEQVDTIPSNAVDWVLVSLREDMAKSSEVAKRAGFVLNDGRIVDMDGISPLVYTVDEGNYYVVVEHRNHISVMSSSKVNVSP